MKNHRFLWLRNRTTDNRKCEKARNIKEKRTIEMFNTVSKPLVAHRSSASADYPLRSESLIPQQNWRWSLWAGAFSIAKRRTHGLIRKNERAYPPLGGAGAAQVGRTGRRGRRIGGGHRVYRHGAALYHRQRHPRRQRAHPDGIHRLGHRAGAGRHPAAAGA